MDTIRLCAPAYGAHALLPHAQDLFGALVKEVYQGSDLTMESIALETIHQVVATLATGISIVNIRDPVERAIEALLHQAVENLKEPELKNAKSASSILRAAGSASGKEASGGTDAGLCVDVDLLLRSCLYFGG